MIIFNQLSKENITIDEKIGYIKARCLIGQLNRLTYNERQEYPKGDIEKLFRESETFIYKINDKINLSHGRSVETRRIF